MNIQEAMKMFWDKGCPKCGSQATQSTSPKNRYVPGKYYLYHTLEHVGAYMLATCYFCGYEQFASCMDEK